jgi:hypothetical protein
MNGRNFRFCVVHFILLAAFAAALVCDPQNRCAVWGLFVYAVCMAGYSIRLQHRIAARDRQDTLRRICKPSMNLINH